MAQTFTINGAPLELLDVGELALIHNTYKPMDTWLLDKFFPNRPLFDRDDVPLGEVNSTHALAPLVSPRLPGKPTEINNGGKVEYVKPAYYKPKNQITPVDVYDIALLERLRTAGIISTGSQRLSEAEKLMIAQISVMKQNHDAIDGSVLLMAVDLLVNGKYVLESDDYERNEVDYQRDNSLKFTPATAWNKAGATPVSDIRTMIERMVAADGGEPTDAIMSSAVFSALQASTEFQNTFVKPYAGISVPFAPSINAENAVKAGATLKGYMDGIAIWVYDATYKTAQGVKRFIPRDYFGLVSDTQGSVAQCRIKNMLANGAAVKYFDRQWYCEDPSGLMLMTESAPLVVPSNKNGVAGGIGFIQ